MTDPIIRALHHYGPVNQRSKAIEELLELALALKHFEAGKASPEAVRGEIADVHIMLEQLKIIYGQIQVEEAIVYKLKRLKDRMES